MCLASQAVSDCLQAAAIHYLLCDSHHVDSIGQHTLLSLRILNTCTILNTSKGFSCVTSALKHTASLLTGYQYAINISISTKLLNAHHSMLALTEAFSAACKLQGHAVCHKMQCFTGDTSDKTCCDTKAYKMKMTPALTQVSNAAQQTCRLHDLFDLGQHVSLLHLSLTVKNKV